MAFIGLKYMVFAPISAETASAVTYDTGFVIGKAITANVNITSANVMLYGDDAVAEADTGFTEGTVEWGVTKMTDDIQTKILGHTLDSGANATGEIIAKGADSAPEGGIGFYAPKLVDGVKKFRGIWFTKTKASEPNESLATRQGAIAFVTPSITSKIMEDATGAWKREKTFDTEAAAKAWLNGIAGISA